MSPKGGVNIERSRVRGGKCRGIRMQKGDLGKRERTRPVTAFDRGKSATLSRSRAEKKGRKIVNSGNILAE